MLSNKVTLAVTKTLNFLEALFAGSSYNLLEEILGEPRNNAEMARQFLEAHPDAAFVSVWAGDDGERRFNQHGREIGELLRKNYSGGEADVSAKCIGVYTREEFEGLYGQEPKP